jgi:hypothetical protein
MEILSRAQDYVLFNERFALMATGCSNEQIEVLLFGYKTEKE